MRHIRSGIAAALGIGLLAAAPAFAQSSAATPSPQQTGHVRAGTLRCDVAPGTSFVFGSTRDTTCVFTPTSGRAERYTGEIKRYGVDVGFTSSAVMLWGVVASSGDVAPGALAGTYAGVSAGATAGVGVGANVLVGGGNRNITLQPLSVEGNTGLNIALGVGELTLAAAR
ncbi:DUF992 domain-containing protein [Neoroseomonas soli]|uniref:DUF992 domain-containing protein n=1 Tax=Neoroseomonas soli TaxID=1081025 RepID=A0A9X9X3C7_9PROT|nr:DUF992 domain-containing protein [Neoroseomonas soli]MBR0673906.1 DUF992 domain-containing protein [Neoroseomonas soli]